MRAHFLFFLAFLAFATESSAQRRERMSLSYTVEGAADVDGGGRLTLRETEFRTGYPIARSDTHVVTVGARWTRYDFSGDETALEKVTAYSLRFPIRVAVTPSNAWSALFILTPALRTDFENLTADDFGFNALALANRAMGGGWTASAGVVYGQEFGRTRVFPALGATWNPDEAWSLELLYPRPRLHYRPSEMWSWSLSMEPGGDQWNLELPRGERDVSLKEFRAALGVERRLARRVALIGQSGLVFGRELESRDGRRKESTLEIEDTWFVRVGFSLL